MWRKIKVHREGEKQVLVLLKKNMNKKELKKLSRIDLLELLLEKSKELDEIKIELEETKRKLNEKEIIINNAGSIVEAAFQLNDIFRIAQETANQYVESVKKTYEEQGYIKNEPLNNNFIHSQTSQLVQKENNSSQNFNLFEYDLKESEIKNWNWDVD